MSGPCVAKNASGALILVTRILGTEYIMETVDSSKKCIALFQAPIYNAFCRNLWWVPLARLADFAVAAASCCLRLHGSFHFQLDTELEQPKRMQIPQILVSWRHYLIASRLAAATCRSPPPVAPISTSGGTALFINRWDPLSFLLYMNLFSS